MDPVLLELGADPLRITITTRDQQITIPLTPEAAESFAGALMATAAAVRADADGAFLKALGVSQ